MLLPDSFLDWPLGFLEALLDFLKPALPRLDQVLLLCKSKMPCFYRDLFMSCYQHSPQCHHFPCVFF